MSSPTGTEPAPAGASGFAPNLGVAAPAAGVVALLLSTLLYDFKGLGARGFPLHGGLWLLAGIGIALAVSALAARVAALPLSALVGGLLGGGFGLAVEGADDLSQLLLYAGTGIVAGALTHLVGTLEAADVVPAVLMSLFFFLIITTFWIAKSMKTGLLLGFYKDRQVDWLGGLSGAGAEQVAKVGNMVIAALAMTAFTWLSRRLRRQKLVYVFAAFFALTFLWYSAALAAPSEATVWTFYWNGDLITTLFLATFFAFLNDSVVPAQAKRMYALVVFGGVLGGAFGSTTVRSHWKALGAQPLMLVCVGAMAAMALVASLAARRLGRPEEGQATSAAAAGSVAAAPRNAAIEGAALVFRSRYLLCLVAIVGIYEFCSATLDYQWKATAQTLLRSEDAVKAHTSTVYAITNWAGMLVQLLVTGTLLRRFGVGPALLVLPVAILANSVGFLLFPTVLLAAGLSIGDNALNYSVHQSARESLYVPTSREEKYKAKAFIDMFVQRFGKVIAVGLALAFDLLGPGYARWMSLAVLLMLVAWIGAARYAGRRFREMTGSP